LGVKASAARKTSTLAAFSFNFAQAFSKLDRSMAFPRACPQVQRPTHTLNRKRYSLIERNYTRQKGGFYNPVLCYTK